MEQSYSVAPDFEYRKMFQILKKRFFATKYVKRAVNRQPGYRAMTRRAGESNFEYFWNEKLQILRIRDF